MLLSMEDLGVLTIIGPDSIYCFETYRYMFPLTVFISVCLYLFTMHVYQN